jgi:hypothetical protein
MENEPLERIGRIDPVSQEGRDQVPAVRRSSFRLIEARRKSVAFRKELRTSQNGESSVEVQTLENGLILLDLLLVVVEESVAVQRKAKGKIAHLDGDVGDEGALVRDVTQRREAGMGELTGLAAVWGEGKR